MLPACAKTITIEPSRLPDIIQDRRSGKDFWIEARDAEGKPVEMHGPIEQIRIYPKTMAGGDAYETGRWEQLAVAPPGDAPLGVYQQDHSLELIPWPNAPNETIKLIPPRKETTILLRRKENHPLASLPLSDIERVEIDYEGMHVTRKVGIALMAGGLIPIGLGTWIYLTPDPSGAVLDNQAVGVFVGGIGVSIFAGGVVCMLISLGKPVAEVRPGSPVVQKESGFFVSPGGVGLRF